MIANTFERLDPKAALLNLRIIWAGMMLGLIGFMFVVIFILSTGGPARGNPQMAPVLFAIAVAMLVTTVPIGYFVRMQVYKRSWRGEVISTGGYTTGNIILFACCEGPAFFALILVLMNRSFWPEIIPAAIAMAIMVINFPNGRAMFPPESFSDFDDRRDTL